MTGAQLIGLLFIVVGFFATCLIVRIVSKDVLTSVDKVRRALAAAEEHERHQEVLAEIERGNAMTGRGSNEQ